LEVEFSKTFAEGELQASAKYAILNFKSLGDSIKGYFKDQKTKDDVDKMEGSLNLSM
jgi:hypothetical protein